jgi:hypothetical protein
MGKQRQLLVSWRKEDPNSWTYNNGLYGNNRYPLWQSSRKDKTDINNWKKNRLNKTFISDFSTGNNNICRVHGNPTPILTSSCCGDLERPRSGMHMFSVLSQPPTFQLLCLINKPTAVSIICAINHRQQPTSSWLCYQLWLCMQVNWLCGRYSVDVNLWVLSSLF